MQPAQPNPFVEDMKKGFTSLLNLFKKPITTTAELAKSKTVAMGLEYMVIKWLVVTIILLIAMADVLEWLPVAKILFVLIILTLGVDCLESVIMHGLSKAFKLQSTIPGMFAVVGSRVVFETIIVLVSSIFIAMSATFGVVVFLLTNVSLAPFQYGMYNKVVEGDCDKKVYAYIIAKICITAVILLISYLFLQDIAGSLMGSLMNFGDLLY